MPDPIAFIHLPRTAGTSIGVAIKDTYGGRRYKVKTFDSLSPNLASEIPRKAEIIYGHMPYGIHEMLPVRYATVLREPISRTLSQYRKYRLQKSQRGSTVDMFEFLRSDSWCNRQARMLSGDPAEATRASLERAKQNLETFEVVGFFDDLDAFAEKIGLAVPLPHVDSAVDSPPADPTPLELKRIRANNRLDTELYEWAKARFGG